MSRILIQSELIADHRGVIASPGAILCEGNSIIAVGEPSSIGHIEDVQITQIDGTVTPAFVNSHAHLDLSSSGPLKHEGAFIDWVKNVVLPLRKSQSSNAICEAVARGAELSLAGGCAIVADIAGSIEAAEAFLSSPLQGNSFVEVFGVGDNEQEGVERIHSIPAEYGVQPHAPYSCGSNIYKAAFQHTKQVSTHIAETLDEIECTEFGTGPLVEFSKELGAWNEGVVPWGLHPLDALLAIAGDSPCIAAHGNYINTSHIEKLAKSHITIAYCPRASQYFAHSAHRWKELMEAGVNVALGTDSFICLDTPDRISVIDEMRLLYERDQGNANELFKMATVNGATALGMNPSLVELKEGKCAGLLAFDGVLQDPLQEILEKDSMPTWIGIYPSKLI